MTQTELQNRVSKSIAHGTLYGNRHHYPTRLDSVCRMHLFCDALHILIVSFFGSSLMRMQL
jgi:hypothetical protein